ncbi:phosphotransferase enzyme family protein [Tepidibacter sp. Z1-5]|uniref:phosphotransferase enzyme family protein n=1 Tax=Tepidibacter sp. Z1-5 TaxID=3134138 RepID=UPI0030C3DD4E
MNTSKMLYFGDLGIDKKAELFNCSSELKNIADNFHDAMDKALVRSQIVDLVENHYDIGKVLDVYEVFGGYINRSFAIYTEKDGQKYEYFIRRYKNGITETEIKFEHSLIKFSIDNGLDIAANLIPSINSTTFVKKERNSGVIQYFAIYDYLDGEDKYSWDNPNCNDEEYASLASILARFHNASKNFNPKGLERAEPKIMDFLPTLPEKFKDFTKKDLNTKFHKYYLKNIDYILDVIETCQIPKEFADKMTQNPCHNDYHPGNLKYLNNKVVGIFDFDWSKIDLRLFDVCLAMAYCCSLWDDDQDGVLRLDKCKIFLKSYQDTLKEINELSPLTDLEIQYLPTMMAAANMYLINWDVCAYYDGVDLNEYEYTAYLQHNVRLMKWIENHKDEIANMTKSL